MSLTNEVRLVGFCSEKPTLKTTRLGQSIATLTVYTHHKDKNGKSVAQGHRCVFFGGRAEYLCHNASKGRHIHIRGEIRSERKGEGEEARYYTSILVEDFQLSPRQILEDVREVSTAMVAKR